EYKGKPTIIWVRNVDQWPEDIRTALNGLLEDGYIDITDEKGVVTRYFKPKQVHLVMELPLHQASSFSSAAFSRFIELGVSNDYGESVKDEKGNEVVEMLHEFKRMGLSPHISEGLMKVYMALRAYQQHESWSKFRGYKIGPLYMYALGKFVQQALLEDRQRGIDTASEGHANQVIAHESNRLIRVLLDDKDRLKFQDILKSALGLGALPAINHDIVTDNGQEDGVLVSAGGVDLNNEGRLTLKQVQDSFPVLYTHQVIEILSLFARCEQTGQVLFLEGAPGLLKTSIGELYATMTGKRFYKYQSHVKSRISDMTIDVVIQDGEASKKLREFYEKVKEGNVVIDFDEVNIAPWMLYVLEPLLRQEEWIQPVFPEERPFQTGKGVVIMATRNADYFALRQEVDQRFEERSVRIQMLPPSIVEQRQIVASFWGIPHPIGTDESLVKASKEDAKKPRGMALEADYYSPVLRMDTHLGAWETWIQEDEAHQLIPRQAVSTSPEKMSLRPEERALPLREIEPIAQEDKIGPYIPHIPDMPQVSQGEHQKQAHGVFDPDLYPYTRHASYDSYDERSESFGITNRHIEPVLLQPGHVISPDTMEVYEGSYQMNIQNIWRPLPSAGAGMVFEKLEVRDSQGDFVEVQIGKDSADNYYIKADKDIGVCQVRYRVGVSRVYRHWELTDDVSFTYPKDIPVEVRWAMGQMELGQEHSFKDVLDKLVTFLTSGIPVQGGITDTGHMFRDLVTSFAQKRGGVCRHAAYVFMRMAQGLGIEARVVVSEIHAWVEIQLPTTKEWVLLDLGGWGDPMMMELSAVSSHRASRPSNNIKTSAIEPLKSKLYEQRMQQALKQQGVKSGSFGEGSNEWNDKQNLMDDLSRFEEELQSKMRSVSGPMQGKGKENASLQKGLEAAEELYQMMFDAIQAQKRIIYSLSERGMEISVLQWFLGMSRCFIERLQAERAEDVVGMYLVDASASRYNDREAIGYGLGVTGFNLWRLVCLNSKLMYDISFFDHDKVQTVFDLDGSQMRLGQEGVEGLLKGMAERIGHGGNDLLGAMRIKLQELSALSRARNAKTKYIVVETDGADSAIEQTTDDKGARIYKPRPDFQQLLDEYRRAGIKVIAIGYGEGAQWVQAFKGQGLYYVRIKDDPARIPVAQAWIMRMMIQKTPLPDGDITAQCGLPKVEDMAMTTPGGIDLGSTGSVLKVQKGLGHGSWSMEDYAWQGYADVLDGFKIDIRFDQARPMEESVLI
ncbi:MAG: AAA family ATPase, partial [Candidatus Omnitrophica bacterium]|nr:AAA family ATPase [Candidatus Omnitrophota bacterium]